MHIVAAIARNERFAESRQLEQAAQDCKIQAYSARRQVTQRPRLPSGENPDNPRLVVTDLHILCQQRDSVRLRATSVPQTPFAQQNKALLTKAQLAITVESSPGVSDQQTAYRQRTRRHWPPATTAAR